MLGQFRRVSLRIVPLDSAEASTPPPLPEDVGERMAMQLELSLRLWELSGRPLPQYTRATIPVRITRLDEQGVD